MTTPIKTRPDGSIDTGHYLAVGRQARSDAAADLFRRRDKGRPANPTPRRLHRVLVLGLAAVLILPGLI